MRRIVNLSIMGLFKEPKDTKNFRRSSPGDILEIKGDKESMTVLVSELRGRIDCESCSFCSCSCLCANAACSDFKYTNLSDIMEHL